MQARKKELVDVAPSLEHPPTSSSFRRSAGFLREAVVGSQRDFTEGSIGPAIFILAVPMVLEMVMESLFGIVNVFWVARLGKEATATVGITESLLTMVFAVAMGLSMATTATVARRIGEKDPDGASEAAVQSIILGVVASVAVGIVAIIYAPQMLQLMGASDGVVASGTGYA
jgi:Na+-driven multidrug efflux pump